MEDAQMISDLLITLTDAKEWRETFEGDGAARRFISFEGVVAADNILMEGKRGGWVGALRMPRGFAIEMTAWLEQRVAAELAKLGVES